LRDLYQAAALDIAASFAASSAASASAARERSGYSATGPWTSVSRNVGTANLTTAQIVKVQHVAGLSLLCKLAEFPTLKGGKVGSATLTSATNMLGRICEKLGISDTTKGKSASDRIKEFTL